MSRVIRKVASVGVGAIEILSTDAGSVGSLPPERSLGDCIRDAAPYDAVAQAGERQHLGHLRDMAEHVREIADLHETAKFDRTRDAALETANHCLARNHVLVHENFPWADREPSLGHERSQSRLGLGADLEVVVDHGGLPIEHEPPVTRVTLEQFQQLIDELNESQSEGLERRVPLPVPMGMGDDRYVRGHASEDTSGRPLR